MFTIRLKARRLTHGFQLRALLCALPPAAALFCALPCLLAGGLCLADGAGAVFGGWFSARQKRLPPAAERLLPWLLLALGLLFLLLHSALRFTLRAAFYYRTQSGLPRPRSFVTPRAGLRLLLCDFSLAVRKAGWFALLALPAAISAGTVLLLLRGGALTRPLLCFGGALAALQLLGACACAYAVTRRYCLTYYLMYLHPRLPVREAIAGSVLLTRGKRLQTAIRAAQTLPWLLLGLLPPAAPFVFAYTGLLRAVSCETLYREAGGALTVRGARKRAAKTAR